MIVDFSFMSKRWLLFTFTLLSISLGAPTIHVLPFTVIIIAKYIGNEIFFIKVYLCLKYKKTGYSFLFKKIDESPVR